MGRRHLARELALKVLFELEADGGDAERALQYHIGESHADAETADFARALILGVLEHRQEIDARLAEASRNWGLDQMAKVERTLLRIAAFEILFLPSVPLKAAINESIELAKTFGGPDSGKFVNGILGRIATDAESRRRPGDQAAAMPDASSR
ncbi:MAG: transcription antitermination factor NusB [Chloroflexi bacterium]|nr:MAG: transcription antitermination factor NusB [Chloroflexota bacterium]TMD66263.1 MAG: transcription antitermination factor NusB [Chloroflexota bacterium]